MAMPRMMFRLVGRSCASRSLITGTKPLAAPRSPRSSAVRPIVIHISKLSVREPQILQRFAKAALDCKGSLERVLWSRLHGLVDLCLHHALDIVRRDRADTPVSDLD